MKKSMKKIALASVAGFVMLPMAAQASCYVNGPIIRVLQYADGYSSLGCYIYARTYATSSVYYYTTSTDDNLCTTAANAVTSAVDVGLSGNAAACPTTGTGRYMGVANYMWINP